MSEPLYKGKDTYYLVAVNRKQALAFHKMYPNVTIYLSEKLPTQGTNQ